MQDMWDFALPLAAILLPAFAIGFGAVWLGLRKGLGRMEGEIDKVKDELRCLAGRVARIEGMMDRDRAPQRPGCGTMPHESRRTSFPAIGSAIPDASYSAASARNAGENCGGDLAGKAGHDLALQVLGHAGRGGGDEAHSRTRARHSP